MNEVDISLVPVDVNDIYEMSDGQLDHMLGLDTEEARAYEIELELEKEKEDNDLNI